MKRSCTSKSVESFRDEGSSSPINAPWEKPGKLAKMDPFSTGYQSQFENTIFPTSKEISSYLKASSNRHEAWIEVQQWIQYCSLNPLLLDGEICLLSETKGFNPEYRESINRFWLSSARRKDHIATTGNMPNGQDCEIPESWTEDEGFHRMLGIPKKRPRRWKRAWKKMEADIKRQFKEAS